MQYYLQLKNEGHDIDEVTYAASSQDAVQFFADKFDLDPADVVKNMEEILEDEDSLK